MSTDIEIFSMKNQCEFIGLFLLSNKSIFFVVFIMVMRKEKILIK